MDVAGVIALLSLLKLPACLLDEWGRVRFENAEWRRSAGQSVLAASAELAPGAPWVMQLATGVRAAAGNALAAARAGSAACVRAPAEVAEGVSICWEYTLTPVSGNADGGPPAIVCVAREMTDRLGALEGLRLSQERLALAAHVGGLGIWDYDIAGDVLHCDGQWHEIVTGNRSPDRPVTTMAQFRPLIHSEDVDAATEVTLTAEQLLNSGEDYAIEFRIVRPTEGIRWVRSVACLQQVNGTAVRAVGFVVDVTDARLTEQALREANAALERERTLLTQLSFEDPLTGISNRRRFDKELTRRCRQLTTAAEPLCVGLIDVNFFKSYNDRHGHLDGDSVLRRIAVALAAAARESDVIARYGGDEFAFLVSGVVDPTPVLDRFMRAVADLAIAHPESSNGQLSVSIGCVSYDDQGEPEPSTLLRHADRALYEAKSAGRHTYIIAGPPPTSG